MQAIWSCLVVVAALCVAVFPKAPGFAAEEVTEESREVKDARIARLIEQLGDSQYPVRERAQGELKQLGFAAFDALTEAENSDDVEIASQARYLVRSIRVEWTSDLDPPEIRELLEGYEFEDQASRLQRIKNLANLPGDQGLEWLCRLARYEPSALLAKQAAMAVITKDPQPQGDDWAARAKTIHSSLDRSQRPAAKWLKTYVQSSDNPDEAAKRWDQLAEAERKTLSQHPQETSPELIMGLLRCEVRLLDRLNRPEDATSVIRNMVQVERGQQQSLAELVEWLAKRKAWDIVDEVHHRFASSFDLDPFLLYTLAQARMAQGNREAAEEISQKALTLSASPEAHLLLAIALRERGLLDASDREFRYLTSLATLPPRVVIEARSRFSEILHDRDLDEEAAVVLKGLVDQFDKNAAIKGLLQDPPGAVESIKSRLGYFFACAAARKGDMDSHVKLLDEAIQTDPEDVDVLIALYRLPNQDEERRQKTRELIKQATDKVRADIEQNPDQNLEQANNYNQFAWLVCNTDGDFDEAIRMSLKSIEIKRSGALLDTLAHCYFAKGDYDNALRYQSEAARLDPYSKQITAQLIVVQEAIAKKKQGK